MELQTIQSKIYEIRGQKVILDFDLADYINQIPALSIKQSKETSNVFLSTSCFN